MATTINTGLDITVDAGADLSAAQFHIVELDGTLAGAGALGFPLQNKPDTIGQAAVLRKGGTSKVVAGAAFVKGAKLAANGTGRAITAGGGDNVVGIAGEAAGADGNIVTMEVVQQGIA